MSEDRGHQACWAGAAIAAMWPAVLLVGLWGGVATIVIARRAFTPPR